MRGAFKGESTNATMEQPPQAQHRRLHHFARMGLTGNPFQILPRDALAQVYVAPEDLCASANALVHSSAPVIQIIAQRGWGKSMVLAAVTAQLAAMHAPCNYLYCPPDGSARFTVPDDAVEVVLLDEAQRLRPRCLRRARDWQQRSGGRIIAATHEDLRSRFGPQTQTVTLPRADAVMIEKLFAKRVEAAGGDPALIRLTDPATSWLAEQADGNLRWVEMLCYEAFQSVEPAAALSIDVPLLEQLRGALQ